MTDECLFWGESMGKSKVITKEEIENSMSEESKRELAEIHAQVEKELKPLYDDLGVDMKTEELHWTNGEVFVINKKNRKKTRNWRKPMQS